MAHDPFASNTFSLVLSWVFAVPVFCGMIQCLVVSFKKHEGTPWLLSAWIGLCFLILSPIRYVFFLLTLATSYPFQSGHALWTAFWINDLWDGLAFAILLTVGIALPLLCIALIVGLKSSTRARYATAALLTPITALAGSFLFSLVLPFAAASTHDYQEEDMIRATNGPAYFLFAYIVPRGLVALPPYAADTPQTTTDLLRTHVAWLYLSDREHARFAKQAYPDLDVVFPEGRNHQPVNEYAGAN